MRRRVFAAIAVIVAFTAAPAHAGPGIHLGLSLDPDNFLAGLHWQERAVSEDVAFRPSAEVGFGDVTMIGGNLDLLYIFPTGSDARPYAGGGFTVNWFDFKSGSSTEVGGSILGGFSLNPNLFLEGKLGLGDTPEWKFYVGLRR